MLYLSSSCICSYFYTIFISCLDISKSLIYNIINCILADLEKVIISNWFPVILAQVFLSKLIVMVEQIQDNVFLLLRNNIF